MTRLLCSKDQTIGIEMKTPAWLDALCKKSSTVRSAFQNKIFSKHPNFWNDLARDPEALALTLISDDSHSIKFTELKTHLNSIKSNFNWSDFLPDSSKEESSKMEFLSPSKNEVLHFAESIKWDGSDWTPFSKLCSYSIRELCNLQKYLTEGDKHGDNLGTVLRTQLETVQKHFVQRLKDYLQLKSRWSFEKIVTIDGMLHSFSLDIETIDGMLHSFSLDIQAGTEQKPLQAEPKQKQPVQKPKADIEAKKIDTKPSHAASVEKLVPVAVEPKPANPELAVPEPKPLIVVPKPESKKTVPEPKPASAQLKPVKADQKSPFYTRPITTTNEKFIKRQPPVKHPNTVTRRPERTSPGLSAMQTLRKHILSILFALCIVVIVIAFAALMTKTTQITHGNVLR